MNLKKILNNNKIYNKFLGLPLIGKVGVGVSAFFLGRNLLSSLYSKVYNVSQFDSMHSGRETSMSAYVNNAMTDFGSGWKGLNKNILRLIGTKNKGIGNIMKETLTPFTNNGVNLGKTMIKNVKQNHHKIVSIKNYTINPTLELHKNRNVGHIIL